MEVLVTVPLGTIRGIMKDNHKEFLGIRYAKPPIGDLRFAEPHPVEAWDDVYDATKYAPMAPQVWEDDPAIELEQSEDCLFLNVYTPDTDGNNRPVMFFLHGGAYAIGSGSRPRLYGGHLAEHGDVVVVTIQYRLGPFGFLFMDGVPPNLGLKDQIFALQWVKQNIASFGGNPDNVTLFGQSAGSISVSYLLTMPEAEGLFHKAIAQSATIPLIPSTPEKALELTELLLSKLKVSNGDVDALRTLSCEKIIEAQRRIGSDILSDKHHSPVLDGATIPDDPLAAIGSGFARNIPLVIGHTSDELPIFGAYVRTSNFIIRFLAKRLISKRLVKLGMKKDDLQNALTFYRDELGDPTLPNKEYDQLLTDIGIRLPAIIVADTHSEGNVGTYFYEFAYKAPNLGAAVHASDLFFVFGTLDTEDVTDAMRPAQSEGEKHLSESMMGSWTSFARSGNPNHPNLPEWKEYDRDSRSMMLLDVDPELVSEHLIDRIRYWESMGLL